MSNLLSKLFKRKSSLKAATISPEDLDMEAFFTDVEHLRDAFRELVTTPVLPKRLLVIHGVGGAGKTSLMRMFRLYCKRQRVPVALVSGDESRTPVDVLSDFIGDLTQDGLNLPNLERTLKQYRDIQAKVEREGTKLGDVTKAGAKVAVEIASGYIPVVGPIVAAFGGMGAEAFVDWLRGFLPKSELDIFLDPAEKLTQDFLSDLIPIAQDHRLVLIFDTYEQMTGLDDWVRDLVQHLPANILTVISGRAVLGKSWDRAWPGWMAHARIETLKAMGEETMRTLVHRYYATMHGGEEPDPAQVEEIVQFARGLPLVVTSAVRLWARYGIHDFRVVKAEVVADLVDRLMEGTPPEMRPALEAAAALRWFNKELLRTLLPAEKVDSVYDDLRRFPFVRSRIEGLALHDVVREMLDESLKAHDPERHRGLHEEAAGHFETRVKQATGDERERLTLELLYHRFQIDEDEGTKLFCQMCEELAYARMIYRLRTILNDANKYPLVKERNMLWQDYYSARLLHFEATETVDAELLYEKIAHNERAGKRLRAYAFCDLGGLLAKFGRLGQPGVLEKTIRLLEHSITLVPLDIHLAGSFYTLAHVCAFQGKWHEGRMYLERAKQFFVGKGDTYGRCHYYLNLRGLYGHEGNWKKFLDAHKVAADTVSTSPELVSLNVSLGWGAWGLVGMGRYADAEHLVRESLGITQRTGDVESSNGPLRDLGWVLDKQGKFEEARTILSKSIKVVQELGEHFSGWIASNMGFLGLVLYHQGQLDDAKEYLTQSLVLKQKLRDHPGIPETLNWLGVLHEVQDEWNIALDYYQRSLESNKFNRRYFESMALVDLCRVKYHIEAFPDIPPTAAKAEQLAQQYEYNDHLASLRLTQSHIAWDGHLPNWGTGFDAALAQYQQALIYGLRYNRFMLDEALWGGGIATPLDPIIPHCLERGDEGKQMLTALRDWWRSGINDVGKPRPDTISPIPEGVPLLEAERIARKREPGDGSPQISVVEKIAQALQLNKHDF